MADAEEIQYDNDCLVISIDIVDCPMAEIPLTEVFNVPTMSLIENYHDVIRDSVRQHETGSRNLSVVIVVRLGDSRSLPVLYVGTPLLLLYRRDPVQYAGTV
jgi:hypothetical protein